MSRSGLSRVVLLLLVAAFAVSSAGCSTRRDKILGNKRLIRGSAGFGTTQRETVNPDRDTYVATGESNFGPNLVVGTQGGFDGRAFFRVAAWTLPDTSDTSLVLKRIHFDLPYDSLMDFPGSLIVTLATTASPYDTLAAWPGPAPDVTLGSFEVPTVAPLRIPMSLTTFPLIVGWAKNPTSLPGLVLYANGGSGVVGLLAGQGKLTIAYDHRVSGTVVTDSVSTAIPLDYTLHSPLSPTATGSDAVLRLGGLYELGVPIRFPAMAVGEGITVNEATLRLRVDPSSPVFATGETVDLVLRRLKSPWAETATDTTTLGADSTVLVTKLALRIGGAADSVIAVALPQSIIREWTTVGGINEGIYLTIKNSNRAPEILLGSRESSIPAELQVSITTAPPGRF